MSVRTLLVSTLFAVVACAQGPEGARGPSDDIEPTKDDPERVDETPQASPGANPTPADAAPFAEDAARPAVEAVPPESETRDAVDRAKSVSRAGSKGTAEPRGAATGHGIASEPQSEPRRANGDAVVAELLRLEDELRAAGVRIPRRTAAGKAQARTLSDDRGDRGTTVIEIDCDRVCSVTESICRLKTKICDLASRNPGEDRFQTACERAREDCRLGRDACRTC